MINLNTLRTSVLSVLAITAAAAAVPAYAQDEVASKIVVRVADLNLANHDGAAVALRRIELAADQICGGAPDMREMAQSRLFKSCRSDVVTRAVRDLNQPMLMSLVPGAAPHVTQLAAR
jgi:UrcA family protein